MVQSQTTDLKVDAKFVTKEDLLPYTPNDITNLVKSIIYAISRLVEIALPVTVKTIIGEN